MPHRRQIPRAEHTRPSTPQTLAIRANAQATSHSSSLVVLVSTCRPPKVEFRRHVIRNPQFTAGRRYPTAYLFSTGTPFSLIKAFSRVLPSNPSAYPRPLSAYARHCPKSSPSELNDKTKK